MHIKKEDYVAKISNASPLQLVIITYELILQNISEAKLAKEMNTAEFHSHRAHRLLLSLMESLDMSIEISKNLMSIYIYVNKLLLTAKLDFSYKKPEKAVPLLDEATKIMNNLLKGWEAVAKTENPENTDKVMENSQQLFAGLTYKNGKLEEYIDVSTGKEYKA